MNTKKLLSLYGLKWSPFSLELPIEALIDTKKVEHFCWRVENLVQDGGVALLTGAPGVGKSVALRQLSARLSRLTDVSVAELSRPQSAMVDFYRELGMAFGIELWIGKDITWIGKDITPRQWTSYYKCLAIERGYLALYVIIGRPQANSASPALRFPTPRGRES